MPKQNTHVHSTSTENVDTDNSQQTTNKCEAVLEEQVHPVVKTLFLDDALIFLDDNRSKHTAKMIQVWANEHQHEIKCFYGLFNCPFAFMQILGIRSDMHPDIPFLPLTVDPQDHI